MTSFTEFRANCKMRHDFGDQIQIRYRHADGEDYGTWVSGEEVLQRMRSKVTELRLRGLSRLDRKQLAETREKLPAESKAKAHRSLSDMLGDSVERTIGGNIIGDSVADAVRGTDTETDDQDEEKQRWTAYLQDDIFRAGVLELAWIQLEGSFPNENSDMEPDDWV